MMTRRILRLLAQGQLEIARGKGYDLRTVLAEADSLLSDGRHPKSLRRARRESAGRPVHRR